MPRELFIVPMVTTGEMLGGKYTFDQFSGVFGIPVMAGTLRYSRTDIAIAMIDAPQAYLDEVAAQSDTTRIATEVNIDSVLTGAQVTAIRLVLEANFIPQQFANVGDTRREVIRTIIGMFLFSQRMEGRFGIGWKAKAQARGISLDSTWQDFPQALKNEFIDVRDDHGWTNADLGVTNLSTLREILKA